MNHKDHDMKHLNILASALVLAATCAACGNTDPIAQQLAFNEVGATGNDFVEFYNTGSGPLDVSGYGATDSRKDGLPKLSRTIRFPAGTIVPAGGYLLVLFEGECPASTTMYTCVRSSLAGGGISQSNGENVHLIDPENQVAASMAYPRAAAPSGWTWGRFPNGTGAFEATRRTPGFANVE